MQNVKELKSELRKNIIKFRKSINIDEKLKKDETIYNKLIALKEYKKADTVLCYVSSFIEVDTLKFIDKAIADGKRVAVPKCENNFNLSFYYINSLNELSCGKYNILEPSDKCEKFSACDKSICIVPSLSADLSGYRLGYGKGYYDRFLADFKGAKIVVTYKENLVNKLPLYKDFDNKCDIVITD